MGAAALYVVVAGLSEVGIGIQVLAAVPRRSTASAIGCTVTTVTVVLVTVLPAS